MSATLSTPKTTSGGEIITHLINASDGAGLHFDGVSSYITTAHNDATEFGLSDFSVEFILNQTQASTDETYYFLAPYTGDNRMGIWYDKANTTLKLFFRTTTNTHYDLEYDVAQNFGKVTHYVLAADRSGFAKLFVNGNEVASKSISASSAVNVGNTNGNHISTNAATTAIIGVLYRFRTWNKSLSQAEITSTYESASLDFADQWGSQTSKLTGNNSTFISGLGDWATGNDWSSQTNPSANMVLLATGASQRCYIANSEVSGIQEFGKKYRVTYTASSITGAPYFSLYAGGAYISKHVFTSGTNSFEYEMTASGNDVVYIVSSASGDAITLDDLLLVEIGCVSDYDLAYANPTQSNIVRNRSDAGDGTAAGGIVQITAIDQLNSRSARIGTSAAVGSPADGDLLVSGKGAFGEVEVDNTTAAAHSVIIKQSGTNRVRIGEKGWVTIDTDYNNNGTTLKANHGGGSSSYIAKFQASGVDKVTIDSTGNVQVGGAVRTDAGSTTLGVTDSTTGRVLIKSTGVGGREYGMYTGTAGDLGFYDYTAGANRLTIDSTGNVGIGTSSPSALLNVYRNTATTDAQVRIENDGTGDATMSFVSTGVKAWMMGIDTSDNTFKIAEGSSNLLTDTAITIGNNTGLVTFSGGIAVNDTSGTYGGKTITASDAAGTAAISAVNKDTTGTRRLIDFFAGTTTSRIGSIDTDGSATAYNTSSDYRLKENVTPITGALEQLDSIPVYNFNFKANPTKTVNGFLAHEVAEVVPEAISGTKDEMETVVVTKAVEAVTAVAPTYYAEGDELPDGVAIGDEKTPAVEAVDAVVEVTEEQPKYQGIDQSKLVPLMLAAIKELKAKVTALETA